MAATSMSIPFRLLLRLPPALRCQIVQPTPSLSPLQHQLLQWLPRRPFSISRTLLQHQKSAPKPQRIPKQTSPRPSTRPPKPIRPPPKLTILNLLIPQLAKTNPLLIYRSPSHTSFTFTAYTIGIAFIACAAAQALLVKEEPGLKIPWYVRIMPMGIAVFLVAMGSRFVLAPMKTIHTISLVATGEAKYARRQTMLLQFQMKPSLPLFGRQGPTIEIPLGTAELDTDIPSATHPDTSSKTSPTSTPMLWRSIPAARASDFTAQYANPPPKLRLTILQRLSATNSALVNSGAVFVRNIRRMVFREGMAYVRIPGHGNWKLDLHGCEIVEDGLALEEVMLLDLQMDKSIWQYIRGWLGQ